MIKEKIESNGKRWTKNGFDRTYIDYDQVKDIEVDGFTAQAWFNRHERQVVKIYWDHIEDRLVVTQGDERSKAHIEKAIEQM